jgi:transcriptional regulator with XRE-family HTH domain
MLSLVKTPRFAPDEVSRRLRRAREDAEMTQAALAKRVGMSTDQLRKKEKGENPYYLDEIAKICDVLEAPSLFPFMEWGEAKLADKLLGRDT